MLDEDEKAKGKKLPTRIERKTKEKVAPNLLQEKFKELDWAEEINQNIRLKHKQKVKVNDKNKVIACYMTSSVNPKDKRKILVICLIYQDQEKVAFEYFTRKSFSNFLYRREKALDAVL